MVPLIRPCADVSMIFGTDWFHDRGVHENGLLLEKTISHTLYRQFPVFGRRNSNITTGEIFFLSTIFPCHVWAGKAATTPRH